MKRCELCKSLARTFCESDQASLCWSCDSKVHGANFLVARHSRTLLCHFCQCPTPWQAAGAKLGHTVSFCLRCANGDTHEAEAEAEEEEVESGSEGEELEEEEEEEQEEDDDLGDNQVVPWSSSDSTPPPPAESSSYSSDSDGGESVVSMKRGRESLDLCCLLQDNIRRRSPPGSQYRSVEPTPVRPMKTRRMEQAVLRPSSRSTAIVLRLDPVSQSGVGCRGGEMEAVEEGDGDDSPDNSSRTI